MARSMMTQPALDSAIQELQDYVRYNYHEGRPVWDGAASGVAKRMKAVSAAWDAYVDERKAEAIEEGIIDE